MHETVVDGVDGFSTGTWVPLPSACERLGLDRRRALGPAAAPAASTGRTRDRTRPMRQKRQKVLARAPSTRAPQEAMGYACPDALDNIRPSTWRAMMASGTVKWFNATKGYGFIQPASGGKDVFVHISAVERAGLSTLNEGQQVEYEIISDRGKESAGNLKVK